jgi:hypothetical protein
MKVLDLLASDRQVVVEVQISIALPDGGSVTDERAAPVLAQRRGQDPAYASPRQHGEADQGLRARVVVRAGRGSDGSDSQESLGCPRLRAGAAPDLLTSRSAHLHSLSPRVALRAARGTHVATISPASSGRRSLQCRWPNPEAGSVTWEGPRSRGRGRSNSAGGIERRCRR